MNIEKIRRLKAERQKLLIDLKALVNRADLEKRLFTSDEEKKYKRTMEKVDELGEEITELEEKLFNRVEREEKQNRLEQEYRNRQGNSNVTLYSGVIKPDANFNNKGAYNMHRKLNIDDKRAIIYDKRTLREEVKNDNFQYDPAKTDLRNSFNRYIVHGKAGISNQEFRALQADISTSGGYLMMPMELAKHIIISLDDILHIRQNATTFQLTQSDTFMVPELASDIGDPTWTGEITQVNEDSDMDFSGRSFSCHPLARMIRASNKLLRLSSLNPETIIRDRLLTVAGNVLENNYLNGSGINQPLGVFIASDHGIDSSRDIESSVSASFTADDFIAVEGQLKQQYRKFARWCVSRRCLERIRKLKDGEGNYLLNKDLRQGGAETLLGYPLMISEYAPSNSSSWSSGDYCAILGDFRFYYIIDNLQMQITRLDELYALTNQTAFLFRYEGDGNVSDPNAFVRLKLQ